MDPAQGTTAKGNGEIGDQAEDNSAESHTIELDPTTPRAEGAVFPLKGDLKPLTMTETTFVIDADDSMWFQRVIEGNENVAKEEDHRSFELCGVEIIPWKV